MNKPLSIALLITAIVAILLSILWNKQQTETIPQAQNEEVSVPDTMAPPEEEATPSSVTSTSGNITVTFPLPNDTIGTQLVVQGQARVFESTVNYRLTDASSTVLASGIAMAQAPDIGQFGPYAIATSYLTPGTSTGTLEVFAISPEDGSEIDMVSFPITF
jgi:hypothetical protein